MQSDLSRREKIGHRHDVRDIASLGNSAQMTTTAPILSVVTEWPSARAGATLLAPVMRDLPVGQASVLALRPTRNANGDLFAAMAAGGDAPAGTCAGYFAVDPFVRFVDLMRHLDHAGIREVANWPSVGMLDDFFQQELTVKNMGYDREIDFIGRAAEAGLTTTATVFTLEQAVRMVEAGASRLLLHPPLWSGRLVGGEEADHWAIPIAEAIVPDIPVLLYAESAREIRSLLRLAVFAG
jgi:predicted TIM-barrel enzyme